MTRGRGIKVLVSMIGLDSHTTGAQVVATLLRDAGFEVVYLGVNQSPAMIVGAAIQEDVDVIGLSILSGSHRELVPRVVELLRDAGVEAPVIVGGIIPPADAEALTAAGIARVYTPKDFDLNRIMVDVAELVAGRIAASQPA